MAYDLKVPKTPGAKSRKRACGRCGLIKGGGISSFVAAFCTKSQRLAMLPGGTKLATHDLTATAISAARVAPIISHRREGGKRNLEDAHHRFPSEGDSFQRKTFRHFPEKFSPIFYLP